MGKNETMNFYISVGAAIFAGFLIYSYIQRKTQEASKDFGTKTSVVTASTDINEMETVQENMVELRQIPERFLQPGYVQSVEDIAGTVALAPISKGEQILRNKIIKPGPETGLSLQISPGKRALALPADEARAAGRLLKPGDRIDILVALSVGDGADKKKYIKTLLQDVVILSAGMDVANELPRIYEDSGETGFVRNLRTENKFSIITVEVTPREAQNLVYILSTSPGDLFYSLRHPSDNSKLRLQYASLAGIYGAPPPQADRKAKTK